MKKKFYDYAKIKEEITIEHVMVFFDLKGEPDNNGYRTSCPTCGGERSLSLYNARGLFTCHQSGASGSVLDLAMHIENCTLQEAADLLLENQAATAMKVAKPSPLTPQSPTRAQQSSNPGFNALEYLHADDPLVQQVGFPIEVAQQLGIGTAFKGLMKGYVAIPIRTNDGTLCGYIGVKTDIKTPAQWHGIANNVVPLKKRRA